MHIQSVGRGIALTCIATALFILLEMSAKAGGALMPVLQVIWARYTVHLVLMGVWFGPRMGWGLLRTRHPWLQILRSALLFGVTGCVFLSLRYLQMAEVTAISLAAPFIVAVLSVVFLRERVGVHRWAAILLGFLGVLIVIRPGAEVFQPAALLPVLAALLLAIYLLVTRSIAADEDPVVSIFFTSFVGAVAMSVVVPFVWETPADPIGYVWMIGVGVFGGVGHYLLILASRHAPASLLAPYYYTQIFWSVLVGYLAFNDVPDAFTLLGAGVIVLAGLYLWLRERRAAAV